MSSEPVSLAAALMTAILAMSGAIVALYKRVERLHQAHRDALERIENDHRKELLKQETEHHAEVKTLQSELRSVEKERTKAAEESRGWALGLQAQHIASTEKMAAIVSTQEKQFRQLMRSRSDDE